jgi:hypothetical protein
MTHKTVKIVFGFFLLALLAGGSACTTTPDCELDQTGTLKVINNDTRESEVRLDGSKIFILEGGGEKEHKAASGTHDIRCFTTGTEPDEVQGQVTITDCETTTYEIQY